MTREVSKKVLSVTIDIELYEKIDMICELQGDTRSAFVERALKYAIQDKEEYLADMEKPHYRMIYDIMSKTPDTFIHLATKIIGESLNDEELARIRKNTSLYAAEGIKRQQQKKATKKKASKKEDKD